MASRMGFANTSREVKGDTVLGGERRVDRRDDPLLVGVDFGTTHIRALVVSLDGTVAAIGSAPTPISHPRPGRAEHDPESLWQATVSALQQATGQLDDPKRIAGLAVASVGEAGVPLDAAGHPTHPAMAWFDTRAEAECAHLTATIGADRLAALTGCGPNPMFGLCKMMWLKNQAPEAYARTTRWLNMADYLAWRLCGVAATDYSLASRTLALDLASGEWAGDMLTEAGIDPGLLQPLTANGAKLGNVTSEAARATGLPEHCVVGVGGHDHIVGALAAGAWRPGTLLNSLGTAEALLLAVDRPVSNPGLARAGYVQGAMRLDRPYFYLGAANFTAGASVDWLHCLVGAEIPHETLIGEAEKIRPGCQGVHFLPTLRVGNPPYPDPVARGSFVGLYPEADRAVLYRAVLEGLAYEARQILDGILEGEDAPVIERIRAVGGLSRNRLLMSIKAAVFNRPITVLEMAESTGLGAAILGGLAAGVFPDVETALEGLNDRETEIVPNRPSIETYAHRYRSVYHRLRSSTADLHAAILSAEDERSR